MTSPATSPARAKDPVFDHVGSLLRPKALKQAVKDHRDGNLSDEGLTSETNRHVDEAIRRQEDLGFPLINDGEFRRGSWFLGFVEAVDGIDLGKVEFSFQDDSNDSQSWFGPKVTAKVRRTKPVTVEEFSYTKDKTHRTAKVTMPTPSAIHFFGGPGGVDPEVYPDIDEFFIDLAAVYQQEITALYDAGCRHVQLDEVPLALLCDPTVRAKVQARGEDPERLVNLYVKAMNDALAQRPAGMTVGMHLCRGNYKGRWMAEGGYDPVAEQLFHECDVDVFLLEFDSDRAGGFEPLNMLPADKRAQLGLITTKSGALENVSTIARRVDDAARHADIGHLGLCPQCGFASSAGGNPITEEEQWAKLSLVREVADTVWGT
jgi:5-methyltetrahydropteroyltriglutamate--homocysteine methyltransferase